jgi:uncharacterized membrane protein
MVFFWTLLISVTAVFFDAVLKMSADKKSISLLVIACILYMIDAIFWYNVYKIGKFSTIGILYSVFTILLTTLVGINLFKEEITAGAWVGICMGLVSVILLSKYG